MLKKYFKCTLVSDIVLNASLATEGNMQTLDYIPGSNFLGIVAGKYNDFKSLGKSYQVFHSGEVCFGDAHIYDDKNASLTYKMPYVLFQKKSEQGIPKHKVYVNPQNNYKDSSIQWEQHRKGYFNLEKYFIPQRKFSLKSAQDRKTRKSKNEAMFGFESLKKGQSFVFSVDFKDTVSERIQKDVVKALIGKRRVGKSKTAQYGQVDISELTNVSLGFKSSNNDIKGKQLSIYVESNLCLLNEFGQPTFQPTIKDFINNDANINGTINWKLTQIRTYSYSPWNSHRKTTNTQRDCILKGSVIVFDLDNDINNIQLKNKVGGFQEEGLGKVLYNPSFLDFKENGEWNLELSKYSKQKSASNSSKIKTTPLGKFIHSKQLKAKIELQIGKKVQDFLDENRKNLSVFEKITSSQWGIVRSAALQSDDIHRLKTSLFEKGGILVEGVAAEMYWDKKNGQARTKLENTINNNIDLGTKFIAKLATEMAKETQM